MILFTKHDFHWRDSDKVQTERDVETLNTLTQEQKEAVERFARSRYQEGNDDGYEQAANDHGIND